MFLSAQILPNSNWVSFVCFNVALKYRDKLREVDVEWGP